MTGANVISDSGVTTTTAINNPSIATFALHPDDVLKLVSASRLGEIYMSLRPTKPRSTYSGAVEYTIESINTPPPEPEPVYRSTPAPAPVENPLPVIPSNATPAMPLPQIPGGVPAVQAAPKIEIIQGDQITQQAEAAVITPTMPVIPSGVEAPVANPPVVRGRSAQANFSSVAEPVSDTTLSRSRVAQSFPQR